MTGERHVVGDQEQRAAPTNPRGNLGDLGISKRGVVRQRGPISLALLVHRIRYDQDISATQRRGGERLAIRLHSVPIESQQLCKRRVTSVLRVKVQMSGVDDDPRAPARLVGWLRDLGRKRAVLNLLRIHRNHRETNNGGKQAASRVVRVSHLVQLRLSARPESCLRISTHGTDLPDISTASPRSSSSNPCAL